MLILLSSSMGATKAERVAHLLYCAPLIFNEPSIMHDIVPASGDNYG